MDRGLQQIQLIDGEGNYNLTGIESFARKVKLSDCGLSYAVIAIMGPQSSGKSTLLNHLFGTKFVEMDALKGRSQTTKGVWLARAPNVEPTTLVMDLEGTDGRERGEDDTTFEKQSSLFALAVADVLLINMWCHDIGREHAANKPLLKIVFQMMMRLFTPRKSKLLFIIRDKTRTPLETLEPILREDIHKIWDSLPMANQQKQVQFEDFFQIEVVALSNFEEKEEQFKEQVAELRARFENSIAPGGIAGDRRGVVPGTALALSMQEMWKVIKDNKDLDLPAHKIMVATVRCEEIAAERIAELKCNQQWLELERKTKLGAIPGFAQQAGDVLKAVMTGYDVEAAFFDESVRAEKRRGLFTSAVGVIQEAFTTLLGHRRAEALEKFKTDLALSGNPSTSGHADGSTEKDGSTAGFAEAHRRCTESALKAFDKAAADALVPGAGWDYLRTRQKLQRDIDAHALLVRTERLAAIHTKAKETLQGKLAEPAASLLDAASSETWPALRALLSRENAHAKRELSKAVAGFELEPEEEAAMEQALEDAGRDSVERRAKEESMQALIRMKERFNTLFGRDSESMPRTWTGKEDIRAITREARLGALGLLSVLAAVRLDEIDGPDTVGEALETLLEGQEGSMALHAHSDGESGSGGKEVASRNALAGATWENIPSDKTLLTPSACRSLWRQFKAETEYTISSAITAQEAHKRSNSWLPPPWAIVAMIVLGFNEFMALVRNPVLLCVVVAGYYVGRALWVQLDASAEFENGVVPGLLSISAKFVPTLLRIMKRLYEDGQHRVQHAAGIQMQDFAASNRTSTTWQQNGHRDDASSRVTGGATSQPLRHRAAVQWSEKENVQKAQVVAS